MKTNKKVQKNNVQKSEKETAVKVTAWAIIPKPMMLLSPQNVPTATEVASRTRSHPGSHHPGCADHGDLGACRQRTGDVW